MARLEGVVKQLKELQRRKSAAAKPARGAFFRSRARSAGAAAATAWAGRARPRRPARRARRAASPPPPPVAAAAEAAALAAPPVGQAAAPAPWQGAWRGSPWPASDATPWRRPAPRVARPDGPAGPCEGHGVHDPRIDECRCTAGWAGRWCTVRQLRSCNRPTDPGAKLNYEAACPVRRARNSRRGFGAIRAARNSAARSLRLSAHARARARRATATRSAATATALATRASSSGLCRISVKRRRTARRSCPTGGPRTRCATSAPATGRWRT